MAAYTKKELRNAYNISTTTLIKWMKRLQIFDEKTKSEKFLTNDQLQKIFSIYGNPFNVTVHKPLD